MNKIRSSKYLQSDCRDLYKDIETKLIEEKISEGNKNYHRVYRTMAYQISKEIGAMSAVLRGVVDAIVLTGGLSHSRLLTDWITDMVCFIAPVKVFPGEDEMRSLAEGGLRVLQEREKEYEYD